MTTTRSAPTGDRATSDPALSPGDGIGDAGRLPGSFAGPVPRRPSLSGERGDHRRLRYVVVGLVLVGAFAFLLVKGLGSALDFYLPANQAVAQKAQLGERTFNLEGLVQPGSIHATTRGVDFVLTSGRTRVSVDNAGSPPQLFQADIPVIAVGHFARSGFVSDQILVKHTATYIAAHPGRVTAPNGTKR
jgi:cytochrome c-type biogenesis protein CcmE